MLISEKVFPEIQSGFIAGYSNTTTLLNIIENIINIIDDNKITLFDLVDFDKLQLAPSNIEVILSAFKSIQIDGKLLGSIKVR